MKNILALLLAIVAFNALPVFADEGPLPEIAPVDEPAIPPLDAAPTE
ncbi:MAG: hypothetical protein SFU55_10660 [Methylophilus sp.]|nr:hypothetical protein [Methylophilus sp.]